MPHKCFLCPKKGATLSSDAVKCANCGAYYHNSCAKKAKPNEDMIYAACCGNEDYEEASLIEEESDLNVLDPSAKALYKLLSKKIDYNFKKFSGVINKIKYKISDIEGRLDIIEDNSLFTADEVIAEIQDQKDRENNIIVYNAADSKNANSTDKKLVIDLVSKCNDAPPFIFDDIIVSRLGSKFQSGSSRPLKVTLPNKDSIHWFFHNKKIISDGQLSLSADLTRKQRDYRAKVVKELKFRKSKGEEGIFIKYIRGLPTIVDDKSYRKSRASSLNTDK